MSHQFLLDAGQEHLLNALYDYRVPGFDNKVFLTDALYDTTGALLINSFMSNPTKLPAVYGIDHEPGDLLNVTILLEQKASNLVIGIKQQVYPALEPIEAIRLTISPKTAELSFLHTVNDPDSFVEIPLLNEHVAELCTKGLMLAVYNKILHKQRTYKL